MNLEEVRREGLAEAFWRAVESSASAHLTYEVLDAIAGGRLDVTGQAAVQAHSDGCPRCRAELADFLLFAAELGRAVDAPPARPEPAAARHGLLSPVNLLVAAIFLVVAAVLPFAFTTKGAKPAAAQPPPSTPSPVLPANVHSIIPAYDETRPMVDFGSEQLPMPVMIIDPSGTALAVIRELTGSRAPIEEELMRGQTYRWESAGGATGRFRILSAGESARWKAAREKASDPLAVAETAIGFGLLSEAESRLKPLAASDALARQMLKELARTGTAP